MSDGQPVGHELREELLYGAGKKWVRLAGTDEERVEDTDVVVTVMTGELTIIKGGESEDLIDGQRAPISAGERYRMAGHATMYVIPEKEHHHN